MIYDMNPNLTTFDTTIDNEGENISSSRHASGGNLKIAIGSLFLNSKCAV